MTFPTQPIRRDAPTVFPHCCEICGGQKGPIMDTMIDRPAIAGAIRVMICRSCSRDIAVFWGFAKGEKMDSLMKAEDTLDEAEKMVNGLVEQRNALDAKLKERNAKIVELEADLEHLRGQDEQRRFIAAQLQTQVNELVAG